MECSRIHLLMLVMTFDTHNCHFQAGNINTIHQRSFATSKTSKELFHISRNVSKYNLSNSNLPDQDSTEKNVINTHLPNNMSSTAYYVTMFGYLQRNKNKHLQNISSSAISRAESTNVSWWRSSHGLTSLLSRLPFMSRHSSCVALNLDKRYRPALRHQRSASETSRLSSPHNNKQKSFFVFPNSTISSVTSLSSGLTREVLGQEITEGVFPTASLNEAQDNLGTVAQPQDNLGTVAQPQDNLGTVAQPKTLYIGGLFELSGKYAESGYSELDAALLAISRINDQGIIPGYKLKLLYNDSKCDPGIGTDAFFDFIYRKSRNTSLMMVMGSACSEVTKTLAEIVPYWNLVLISYAATSPALSEREIYRTFFRLALGDSALNPARRMLIKHFLWDKVAALYEDLESMSLAFNEINQDFALHGIVIKFSTSFKDAAIELPGQLKDIKELDVRIIVAGFSEATARQVFCEAYKEGMYGSRYVWILVGGYTRQWWKESRPGDTECSQSQLTAAVETAFTVVDFNGLLEGTTSLATPASSEFLDAYLKANSSLPISMYATGSYDTVLTMAYTIRDAMVEWQKNGTELLLDQLRYEDMAAVKEAFVTTMENLEFKGVSGPVSFSGSDREGIAVVYQIQEGNLTQVAIHQPASTSLDFDCKSCSKVIWRGGRIPKDEQIVVPRLITIERFVFSTITILCACGIVLAVFFLTYNLYHGRLKFIKLSSPKLNNVAVIGCILVYTAVVMMGFDDRVLTDQSFPIVCSGRAFLLAAGFSLAFGAMFAKTFRVHQIFTRTHHGLVKSKLIQDTHLLVIIGVLLAVDSVMVIVWVVVDPMSRKVTNITKQVSAEDEDLIFQEQLATCHSNHLQKWLGAFYAYKGLLLIFGVYMAWETRHVQIPALNDSQYIGLNVYNVVIMSVSVVVISNILSSQPNLLYAMEAVFMLLSTTVTLCLLFVPKIYVIVTSGGNPVIASMGIVVDNSNTRRFVFDDRKEIYYRAEVQNRVYKRELVELDQKISRLERLLEIPLQPYPMLTEELLYLLPESKVDGTPPCHKRYKRELERCTSISDGGEGVVFDISESDILMEMTFTSMNPKPLMAKRHSSVETSKSSNSALQKLSRSLSISGGGGRGRKRKKGRELIKSPMTFCLSESKFLNKIGHANIGSTRKHNRYSDGMAHIHSEMFAKSATSNVDVSKSSHISSVDKITQTSSESILKVQGGAVGTKAHGKSVNGTGFGKLWSKRGTSSCTGDNEDHLFYDTSNYIHPQLFNSKIEKMFAVQRIQVESVDDDSNSNNGDNDSVDESRSGYLSKSSEVISSPNSKYQDYGGSKSGYTNGDNMGFGSTPAIRLVTHDCEVVPSRCARTLVVPTEVECKGSSLSLSVCGMSDNLQTLRLQPQCRQRSASTPSSPTSTHNPPTSTHNKSTPTHNPPTPTNNSPPSTHNHPTPTHNPASLTYNSTRSTHKQPIPTHNSPTSEYNSSTSTHNPWTSIHNQPTHAHYPPTFTYNSPRSTHNPLSCTHNTLTSTHNTMTSTHNTMTSTHNTSISTHNQPTPTHNPPTFTYNSPRPTHNPPTFTHNPPTSPPSSCSRESSLSHLLSTSPHKLNVSSSHLASPAPPPVCLNQYFPHRHNKTYISSEATLQCNPNKDIIAVQLPAPLSDKDGCSLTRDNYIPSLTGDNYIPASKGHNSIFSCKVNNSDKSPAVTLTTGAIRVSSNSTCFVKGKMKMSVLPSHEPVTMHVSSTSKPVLLSLRDGVLNPLQIYPSDVHKHDIPTDYQILAPNVESSPENQWQSREDSSASSKEVVISETIGHSLLRSQGISCVKLSSAKQVVQAERRRRIERLKYDLVNIQRELQDLQNLELDGSEV